VGSTAPRATESLPRVGREGGGQLPNHRRPRSVSHPAVRPTRSHPVTGVPVRRIPRSAATVPSPRRPARSARNPRPDGAPNRHRGVSSSHHPHHAVLNRLPSVASSRHRDVVSSRLRGASSSRVRRAVPNRLRSGDSSRLRRAVLNRLRSGDSSRLRSGPDPRSTGAVRSHLRPAAKSSLPAAANRHPAGRATPPPTSRRPEDRKRRRPPGRAGSGDRGLKPPPPGHRPRRTTVGSRTRTGRAPRIAPSHRIGRPGDGPFATIRYRHRLRPPGTRPVRNPGGRGRSRKRLNGHGADRPKPIREPGVEPQTSPADRVRRQRCHGPPHPRFRRRPSPARRGVRPPTGAGEPRASEPGEPGRASRPAHQVLRSTRRRSWRARSARPCRKLPDAAGRRRRPYFRPVPVHCRRPVRPGRSRPPAAGPPRPPYPRPTARRWLRSRRRVRPGRSHRPAAGPPRRPYHRPTWTGNPSTERGRRRAG
jgi:hypothetical protein